MNDARIAGVRVESADLGSSLVVLSEYDPAQRLIRINACALAALPADERSRFIRAAVAHELSHHADELSATKRSSVAAREHRARERAARLVGNKAIEHYECMFASLQPRGGPSRGAHLSCDTAPERPFVRRGRRGLLLTAFWR